MSFQDKLTLKINNIIRTKHEMVEEWLLEQLSQEMINLNNGLYCRRVSMRELPKELVLFEFLQIINGLDSRIVCVEKYDGGAWTNMGRGESYFMLYCCKNPENQSLLKLRQ